MSEPYTGDGHFSISRPHCGDGREYLSIRVEDERSSVEFLEVQISFPEFVKALTGLTGCDCSITLKHLATVGKYRHIKEEWVPMTRDYANVEDRKRQEKEALLPFEVDGWRAIGGRLGNPHYFSRQEGKDGYTVPFSRFLDYPQEPKP